MEPSSTAAATEVLALALGPVQGFIQAARKARDLWAGSTLLSRVTRGAAQELAAHLHERGGYIVYPPLDKLREGQPVANKLLAVVPAGLGPAAAEAAAAAARRVLHEVAGQVRASLPRNVALDDDLWNGQLSRFLEVYWAVAPVNDAGYATARRFAEQSLDGRKRLRDFGPYAGGAGRLKSSEDGAFECVYGDPSLRLLRARYGAATFGKTEQLDALGLARRLWKPEGAPARRASVGGIAVAPFVTAMRAGDAASWAAFDTARSALNAAVRSALGADEGADVLESDASDLLSPLASLVRFVRRELTDDTAEGVKNAVGKALSDYASAHKRLLDAGRREHWAPSPYYAVVVADGDGIGRRIDGVTIPQDQTRLSVALAGFARRVLELPDDVNTFPEGTIDVLYAGGDDLLALVSLDQCLDLVDRVRRAFEEALAAVSDLVPSPTLSVGMAIVHAHDSFRDGIARARDAERAAKDAGGASLGIVLARRSGAPREVVLPFLTEPTAMLRQLTGDVRDFEAPHGLPYELERLGDPLDDVPWPVAEREVLRILKRKRGKRGKEAMAEEVLERILGMLKAVQEPKLSDRLRTLSDRLVLALHLAAYSHRPHKADKQRLADGGGGA